MIDYYRDRGTVVDINGEQSVENVFAEIVSNLSLSER